MRFVNINGIKYCCQSDVVDDMLLLCSDEYKKLISCNEKNELSGSNGRGKISKFMLGSVSCVMRGYNRGGYLAKMNQRSFLNFGPEYRPFSEFAVLNKLLKEGVRVPTPVVSLVKPKLSFMYQGAIVLKELVGSENLLDLILLAESEAALRYDILEFSFLAAKEAKKCLQAGVRHIDLHPGNVLISARSPYLIDFDKCVCFPVSHKAIEKGRSFLTERWNRSVQKRLCEESFASQIVNAFAKGIQDSF